MAEHTAHAGLQVEEVPPARYFGDSAGWDQLVRRAGADALFMGHAWQSQWWAAFGPRHELTPCLLEFRRDAAVIGRASLFRRRVRIKGVGFQTLEVLGNLWRGPATFRSEFLDLLAEPDETPAVQQAFTHWLRQDQAWDLMPAMDLAADGRLACALESEPTFDGMRTREPDATSYEVRIEGSIEEYRASLSQNVRRKMFGQRHKLRDALGPIELRTTSELDELERLHTLRWGSPLLHGGRQEFLAGLGAALPTGALHVSLLQAGPSRVSALLNVQVNDQRLYNLQGGFDAASCAAVSPARLHWGLLIEDVFATRPVRCIDLLLGSGRRDDYKQEIARPGRKSTSVQLLRNPVLRMARRVRALVSPGRQRATP